MKLLLPTLIYLLSIFQLLGNATLPNDHIPLLPTVNNLIELEKVTREERYLQVEYVKKLDEFFNCGDRIKFATNFLPREIEVEETADLLFAEEYQAYYQDITMYDSAPPETNDDLERHGQATLNSYLELTKKIREDIGKARRIGSFAELASGRRMIELPLALEFAMGENSQDTYTVVFNGVKIHPGYIQLNTYISIQSSIIGEHPLILHTPNLKFNLQDGLVGETELALVGTFPIIPLGKKAVINLVGKTTVDNTLPNQEILPYTSANISCDGIENLDLFGEVLLSRDWVKPYPIQDTTSRVVLELIMEDLTNISEIATTINVDKRFVMNGMEEYPISIKEVTLDFSSTTGTFRPTIDSIFYQSSINIIDWDQSDTSDIIFNEGQLSHKLINTGEAWEGIYISHVDVTIPAGKISEGDLYLEGDSIILDDNGMSGRVGASAKPLVEFGSSNIGGWSISLEDIDIIFTNQRQWEVAFGGDLYIPILASEKNASSTTRNKEDAVSYIGQINSLNGFSAWASINKVYSIPLLIATGDILPSSEVVFTYNEGIEFEARIDALVSTRGKEGSSIGLNLPNLEINNLIVRSHGTKLDLNLQDWKVNFSEPIGFGPFEAQLVTGPAAQNGGVCDAFDAQGTMVDLDTVTAVVSEGPVGFPATANYDRIDGNDGTSIDLAMVVSVGSNISGAGGFTIRGVLEEENNLSKWVNKDFGVKNIFVNVAKPIPGVKQITGYLGFFDAGTSGGWGDGFRGMLGVSMDKFIEELEMVAQFGSINIGAEKRKYYLVDAKASFSPGINLGGALELTGFSGGYYKNLKRPDAVKAFDQLGNNNPCALAATPGMMLSGIQYSINNDPGETFGFSAGAMIATVGTPTSKKRAFVGQVEFGMEFGESVDSEGNKTGSTGVQKIFLQGVAKFMSDFEFPGDKIVKDAKYNNKATNAKTDVNQNDLSKKEKTDPQTKAAVPGSMISAKVLFQADFVCPSFHGILGVFMKTPLFYGQAIADLYIGRDCSGEENLPGTDWHLFIGKSTVPVEIGINAPLIGDAARLWSYFMIGNHEMPTDVPEPTAYNNLFGDGYNTNPETRSEASNYEGVEYNDTKISSGNGFAFGMGIDIAASLRFLFLKATVNGGIGLDVLIKQLALSDCFKDVGINGYYAKGQAYLYAHATISASINLWLITIEKELFGAGAGALLKMEGPKPFYARGRIDANLNALGLIKVNFSFKAKFGKNLAEYVNENKSNCADEINTSENPIVDEIYPSESEDDIGYYPPWTNFIVECNWPINVEQLDDEEKLFLLDLLIHEKYENAVKHIKNNVGDSIKIFGYTIQNEWKKEGEDYYSFPRRGYVEIIDQNGNDIEFDYEYLGDVYKNDNSYDSKIRLIPKKVLPSGKITVKAPAFAKVKSLDVNWNEFKKLEKIIYDSWIYPGAQIGDPYIFYISDSMFIPTLPEDEVAYTYPIDGMENFYQQESRMEIGVIGNKEALFDPKSIGPYQPKGRFIDLETGEMHGTYFPAYLDNKRSDRQIIYFNKPNNLKGGKEYRLEFLYLHNDSGEINEDMGEEYVVYKIDFRNSKFKTFVDKVKSLQLKSAKLKVPKHDITVYDGIKWDYSTIEKWGRYEIYGSNDNRISKLVTMQFENTIMIYWEKKNLLHQKLFRDYNKCDETVYSKSIHPKHEIEISENSNYTIEYISKMPSSLFGMFKAFMFYMGMNNICNQEFKLDDNTNYDNTNYNEIQYNTFCNTNNNYFGFKDYLTTGVGFLGYSSPIFNCSRFNQFLFPLDLNSYTVIIHYAPSYTPCYCLGDENDNEIVFPDNDIYGVNFYYNIPAFINNKITTKQSSTIRLDIFPDVIR